MDLTFGKWVRSKRKAAGLTQAELAEFLGKTQGYISAVENDEDREISRRVAQAFATALKLPEDEGLIAAGFNPEPSEQLEPHARIEIRPGVTADIFFGNEKIPHTFNEADLRRILLEAELRENTNKGV